MQYVDLIPNSKEWLEYRRTRIGASDTPIIMGVSPFKTPYQLWESKLYGNTEQLNSAMRRGMERESIGVEAAQKKLGVFFEPKIVQHPDIEWRFCSLDGIDMMGEVAIEIKWCNKKVHDMAKRGVVIDYYFPQIQSQLACTGLDKMWFVSCYEENGVNEFEFVEVKRDDLFIEKMIEKEKEFYEKYLSIAEPPPLSDKDYDRLEGDQSFAFNEMITEYFELLEKEKMLDQRKKEILEKIKIQANGKNAATDAFKATKFRVKGRVDYQSIPELNNVNLDRYRKESTESWRISKV